MCKNGRFSGMEKFTLNCLKSEKLVIAKIFAYIFTKDYNNSKTLEKKMKSLKLSRNQTVSLINLISDLNIITKFLIF